MQLLQSIKTALQSRLYFFIIFPAIIGFYLVLQTVTPLSWSSCLLISWNIAIYAYLLLTIKKLWRIDHAHILQRAMQQDASKWIILFLVIITLIICFIAIIIEINHLPQDTTIRTGHLILSILTIISAWFLMHTIFAIHYAHDFYLALDKQQQGGLDFPNTTRPTYPDFLLYHRDFCANCRCLHYLPIHAGFKYPTFAFGLRIQYHHSGHQH